jgi:chromosome segregation ATPase
MLTATTSTELFKGADEIARFVRLLRSLADLEPILRDAASLLQAADEAKAAQVKAAAESAAAVAERDRVKAELAGLRDQRGALAAEVENLEAKRDSLREDLATLRAKVSA